MNKLVTAALTIAMLLVASPAQPQQAPEASGSPATGTTSGTPGLPAVRHLVYQFGYNTAAADSGTGTGTTTVDFVGVAKDGGISVTATDNWWNTVRPRQSYTCEVYPDGGVKCPNPPNAISPIQVAIVPLLGRHYFSALSGGPTATWKQTYTVTATFLPGATSGFAGQVHSWNCAYNLTGKGVVPKGAPVILVHSKGSMKQQSGNYITVNQKSNIAFDPRIEMPVYLDEEFTFVPRLSINSYTIQMKLIKY